MCIEQSLFDFVLRKVAIKMIEIKIFKNAQVGFELKTDDCYIFENS